MNQLVGAVLTRPSIGIEEAATFLRRQWAIEGDLRPLPSERDRNFAVTVNGIDRFVLKISNASEDPAFLELQHAAMRRLVAAGVPCQLPVTAMSGTEVTMTEGDRPLLARVLTWLPGRPLVMIPPVERSRALLSDLGRVAGRTAAALVGFDHPAAHRRFQWAPEEGLEVIAAHAAAVTDPERATLLARWQDRLAPLASLLPALRHGLIHNDAHDHNVLVADDGESISGLLDLGDAVWTITVNELAIPAAYAALRAADPLATIAAVRAGFEEALPLEAAEGELLHEIAALRLATSVALSAHQSRLDPDDPYLTASEAPAWDLLARLLEFPPPTIVTGR